MTRSFGTVAGTPALLLRPPALETYLRGQGEENAARTPIPCLKSDEFPLLP